MAKSCLFHLKAETIKWLALEKGLSFYELEDAAGVNRGTCYKAANGAKATARTVKKLADALGVSPAVLVEEEREY